MPLYHQRIPNDTHWQSFVRTNPQLSSIGPFGSLALFRSVTTCGYDCTPSEWLNSSQIKISSVSSIVGRDRLKIELDSFWRIIFPGFVQIGTVSGIEIKSGTESRIYSQVWTDIDHRARIETGRRKGIRVKIVARI
ncbi:hypothetical protein EVAR_53996_1 [Eumeta japonica]|uniref:Uncharacterized protein n=1 Tax=Eumeta variegata TaxID=151549 RepID=A0A4C1YP19_EUMVA|nr:hypothetical protein EVAR_53996_1 [Eumeta japonica]